MIAERSPLCPKSLTVKELLELPIGAKLVLFCGSNGRSFKVRWRGLYNPTGSDPYASPRVMLRDCGWRIRKLTRMYPLEFLGLRPVSEVVRNQYGGDTFQRPFEGGWTVRDGWNTLFVLVRSADADSLPSQVGPQ